MAQTSVAVPHSVSYVPIPGQRRHTSKHRFFILDLSQALFDFVIQLLPTAEEMAVKEDVRKLLERLIRTIEPDSRLLSFGSTANGFSLRNSDMDLCCLIDSDERLSASDLVTMVGDLLERETKFRVKPLPHARIPIVKLSLDPSPGLPLGIASDIGFENRLALENTRLLMCYAMVDPTRVRTLVLFLKVWSKQRKINSPYQGTLSSYGYVLLVIYFLIHVKNPPVLPNLQQMPPLRPISAENTHIGGHNTWFFDDIELLCQRWHSSNTENVAELLIDFFRYYSRDFTYNTGVASIRAGLLKKDSKGWQNDLSNSKFNDARERNRFCIEDPFETDFNVARCVTKEGLYQIRGEFMRASRILAMRPRAILALSQLCEEKVGDPKTAPSPSIFVPPRLSLPPQASCTVGSSPMQPLSERRSPDRDSVALEKRAAAEQAVSTRHPHEHMAAKRSQWTNPPPPEAAPTHHTTFHEHHNHGLTASVATAANECRSSAGSGNCSETLSDEECRSEAGSDELHSIRSFNDSPPFGSSDSATTGVRPSLTSRGRLSSRTSDPVDDQVVQAIPERDAKMSTYKAHLIRRSHSGPPNHKTNRFSWPSTGSVALHASATARVAHANVPNNAVHAPDASTVFYETTATQSRFPHIVNTYPIPESQSTYTPPYHHMQTNEPGDSSLGDDLSAVDLSDRRKLTLSRNIALNSLPPTHAPLPHAQAPTVTVTSSPFSNRSSSTIPLSQLAQRHIRMSTKPRSPSHSPLRISMHQQGNIGIGMAEVYPRPAFGSGLSAPCSISRTTSLSPSSSPTLLHSHEELLQYSSTLRQSKLATTPGSKLHVPQTPHLILPDPDSMDLQPHVLASAAAT
ncbi:hypothetical protein F5I97DRAFT_1913309 [Phlebopus sp. FC_14]|nr:hypothetical protein F5I97DRAFT_1913309 [Phlebopus sp. FC_14]